MFEEALMYKDFTKPVAHFIPLAEGIDASALSSMDDAALADVLNMCQRVEEKHTYQVNPDVILREIGDEYMLIPTGQLSQYFNGMISLNYFSHFIWQQFEEPHTLGEVLQTAHDQFEDPHHMLDIQVRKLVQDFRQMGILAIVNENNN